MSNMDMYSYGQTESFLNTLADEVQSKLSRIELNIFDPC